MAVSLTLGEFISCLSLSFITYHGWEMKMKVNTHTHLNRPEFRRDSFYWELANKGVAGC
jgi:hypothetical protein